MHARSTLPFLAWLLLVPIHHIAAHPNGSPSPDGQASHATDQGHLIRDLERARHTVVLAERTGLPKVEHAALRDLARAEHMAGLYAEFLGTTLRTLQLAKQMQDVSALAEGLQDLSLAYLLNHQPDKAVEEARNALAMLLPTRDHATIAAGQRFLLDRLIVAGRFTEAKELGERALERAREASDLMGLARTHHLLAGACIAREAYGEAMMHLSLARGILLDRGTLEERQLVYLDDARAAIGLGRYTDARTQLAQAAFLLASWDHPEHRSLYLESQYRLAVAEKRWKDALDWMVDLKAHSDSLTSAHVSTQMAALQVRYQLTEKEADNERLRALSSRQNETIAVQRADHRLLSALLAGMVFLAVALLLMMQRNVRMVRRMRNKNSVIKRQSEEINAKNLEMERQYRRLTEALLSEEEKELTIKEIHHRVKNNLQVVDSLLSLQGGGQRDPAVTKLFREAQGRIRSMALVHEHIFRAGGMTEGTLQNHLSQLARSVLTAYGLHDRVSVSVDTHEPNLPVDTLMPLTLLVNELLTNSVKHAFIGRDQGSIRIAVRKVGDELELLFVDDGVGFKHGGTGSPESFGHQLVEVLAEQLNGTVQIVDAPGTTFTMRFPVSRTSLRLAS